MSRPEFCIVGRCHGIRCFHFLFFCLEATVKTNSSMRAICATVMVIISDVLFWKLLDFSYMQSSVSAITRRIDNGIWNILYSWRCYGHGSTYMLIFYSLNTMKRKLAKLIWKLSVAQNSEPVLWRASHQDNSLIIALFFGSQSKLVFKFNLVLIEYFLSQFVYLYL